jgi:hypothetical protein
MHIGIEQSDTPRHHQDLLGVGTAAPCKLSHWCADHHHLLRTLKSGSLFRQRNGAV